MKKLRLQEVKRKTLTEPSQTPMNKAISSFHVVYDNVGITSSPSEYENSSVDHTMNTIYLSSHHWKWHVKKYTCTMYSKDAVWGIHCQGPFVSGLFWRENKSI